VVPVILFSSGWGSYLPGETLDMAFAAGNESPIPQNNNIYLSFKLDEAVNKNITFEKVNENKTSIVVKDI